MSRWGWGLALVLWLAGCATPVEVDYDTGRDFSQLRRYAWLEPTADEQRRDPVLYNSLTEKRIHQAVDRLLSSRGFQRSDRSAADFLVTYHLKVEQRIESDRVGVGVGYGWPHWGMMGTTGTDIYQYDEETVTVDVLDARSRELLWRGSLSEAVERQLSPKEREGRILRQMHEILAGFPPR